MIGLVDSKMDGKNTFCCAVAAAISLWSFKTRYLNSKTKHAMPEKYLDSAVKYSGAGTGRNNAREAADDTDSINNSVRYLDEFVSGLECASLLLSMRLYPDAKEITESMAMFDAVRRRIDLDISPANKHLKHGVICIGDGASRTNKHS